MFEDLSGPGRDQMSTVLLTGAAVIYGMELSGGRTATINRGADQSSELDRIVSENEPSKVDHAGNDGCDMRDGDPFVGTQTDLVEKRPPD